jgi:hypothetical protein
MLPIARFALVVVAMLLLPVSQSGAQEVGAPEIGMTSAEVIPGEKIVPGEVIVRFEPGTSDQTRDQSLAAVEGVFVRAPTLEDDLVVARVPIGSEVSAASSLEVDTNVVDARPIVVGQSIAEQSALR